VNDGNEGNFKPTLLERIQPYAVYVPTTYKPGHPMPLTWILHSLEVNYNQYGALDPQLLQQLCQDRNSICATTEGFGPAGWYYNEADTDFWQVWHALARGFSLDPARTVSTGYSMGGWASYKLVFEHPDDFAGALVLDGPTVCGIEFVPGENGNAFSDPACSQDGESKPFIHNALWIPYVLDHTYADELVPVQGPISEAQDFDKLGQRYDLFIHAGGDHLAFAIEDRFGDAVAALGEPVRTVNPGRFTYSWYPSLDNAALGIGATGDYWLSHFAARNRSYGTIATIQAFDAALPEPRVTDERFGPALVTQPDPGDRDRPLLEARPPPQGPPPHDPAAHRCLGAQPRCPLCPAADRQDHSAYRRKDQIRDHPACARDAGARAPPGGGTRGQVRNRLGEAAQGNDGARAGAGAQSLAPRETK
jgi:dienelactone hydrolase